MQEGQTTPTMVTTRGGPNGGFMRRPPAAPTGGQSEKGE